MRMNEFTTICYLQILHQQPTFDSYFKDFAEEECILAFINPFSLTEQNILKNPSDTQMEIIDLIAIYN